MAFNSQWDGFELRAPALPYDLAERELSEKPRLILGSENTYVTLGGKLARRPGTISVTSGATTIGYRIDRIWTYETLDDTPHVYTVASVFNSGTSQWELWYYEQPTGLSAVTWNSAGSYRDLNASTRAHEAVAARGKLYVKGFPAAASTEKLGTVVIDGTGGTLTVRPWGILGPTEPARIKGAITKTTTDVDAANTAIIVSDPSQFPAVPFVAQINYEQVNVTALAATTFTVTRGYNDTTAAPIAAGSPFVWRDWSSSDHIVTVNQYWRYAYAYKTITGHISNRSPEETNPDELPSRTGPFFDQCPVVTIAAHSDTTNVPYIVIYRSTDGGGTFYKLTEVANPGTSLFPTFEFTDNLLESGSGGGTFNDPTPDSVLDTQDVAPSLTSNSPPPTVLSPSVTGTDTPVVSTRLAYFQGRIWFAIGNYVFFSANEELNSGIPEEAFPSGTFGNFFKYQEKVCNLERTSQSLFIGTTGTINAITGTTRDTFASRPIYESCGMVANMPEAITRFADKVAFLSHDYRLMVIDMDGGLRSLSDPLADTINSYITLGGSYSVDYLSDREKEWLILTANVAVSSNSRQWVYDVRRSNLEGRDFWFPPWTYPSVCAAVGRTTRNNSRKYLMFADYTSNRSELVYLDPNGNSASSDCVYGNASRTFDVTAVFGPMRNPTGNHVNELRRPGMTSVVNRVILERTKFSGDTDPVFTYCKNDISGLYLSPSTSAQDPARRDDSIGYKTLEYHINQACDRFGFRVILASSDDLFEIQNYAVIWQPESGA